MLYTVTVALHVITAILAVGMVTAIPLAVRGEREPRTLALLLRGTQFGFLGMLLTGIVIDVSAGGAFHRTGWLKASVVVLVVAGFAHARARAALRAQAYALVERWGWVMCAAIAVITVLMQTKPLP